MPSVLSGPLPTLPLLLWETPPGLELALAQEGVPFVRVREPHPWAFRAGRFVLVDGRAGAARVRPLLSPGHSPIDVDTFRRESRVDPFAALVDDRAGPSAWRVGGFELVERVARVPKAAIRRRLMARLREAIACGGGVWARLGPFPFPYRSAFGFRADLDEPIPSDYARFALARRPLDDCTTHFVSTHAYGRCPDVLDDLRGLDAQSHGHFHVVYRDPGANRRNVARARDILASAGLGHEGFAAPEGRWNAGLDEVLEEFGYQYSSDFHLGYDDYPFFPWRGDRFSNVLQVPIHPICEGLFLEAGAPDGRPVAEHLADVVRAKVAAGEPAFVYGHPERRLGRFPGVVRTLARAVAEVDFLWRVTLTEYARWWRWRASRRWSLVPKADGVLEVQFDDWDARYPLTLEVWRGRHAADLPVTGPRTPLRLDGLAYVRRPPRPDLPAPRPSRCRPGIKAVVRAAIDWETVTPLDELPADSLAAVVKKGLRRWHGRQGSTGPHREFRRAKSA
jgi:hypothetical protein